MAVVRGFQAVRPAAEFAEKVAALPYDVMNSDEARKMVEGNPYSFLHVDKAEIDLDPSIDLYDVRVYEKARANLDDMVAKKILVKDEKPQLYIYRQIMNGRAQTGLVACTAVDDYINNIIKKHEFTRADKELDRINHVDHCNANTGPIFLAYRTQKDISAIIGKWIDEHKPVYDFVAEDGVSHIVWLIDDVDLIGNIEKAFLDVDYLYIADGHHRAASACKVGLKRREAGFDGDEEFNQFLSVLFPSDELYIMDYNRVVKDLNGLSAPAFLEKLSENFNVEQYNGPEQYRPDTKHSFGLYVEGKWYKMMTKQGVFDENDPVDRLDVSILQKNVLAPILGIEDPRTDKRIDFVGGIRGLAELEERTGAEGVAFSMFPTTIDDLMAIADAGEVMPPKSTWFEPKLRSGLFVHELT